MTDLRILAEIMDRRSKRPDDYHSQAALALKRLAHLESVASEILEASHDLSELWHQECAGYPDTDREILRLGIALDRVEKTVRKL